MFGIKRLQNILTTYYGQLAFLKLNPNLKFELNKDMDVDSKV